MSKSSCLFLIFIFGILFTNCFTMSNREDKENITQNNMNYLFQLLKFNESPTNYNAEDFIEININDTEDKYMGQNGTLYFSADSDKDKIKIFSDDLEERLSFDLKMKIGKKEYSSTCRLWKSKESLLVVICKFKDLIPIGKQNLEIKKKFISLIINL